MVAKIEIKLKNEDGSHKQSDHILVYDSFTCDQDDPIINEFFTQCKKRFNDEIDDVKVKIDLLVDSLR